TVGHHPAEAAPPGHTKAARIVDDDKVDAASFLALGAEPGACPAPDDWLAGRDLPAQAFQDLVASEEAHGRAKSFSGGVEPCEVPDAGCPRRTRRPAVSNSRTNS